MKQLIPVFLFASIGMLLFSCEETVQQEESYLRPVKYGVVSYLDGAVIRTFSGAAQTDKVIKLSFRNTGIITQFNIKLGQRVRKGQLLGRLDNVQARLSYEQSITDLNSTESQMNTAKLSLNRTRALFEKGSSSLSDFESAKNAYRTAQESFQSAKRGVDIQKEQVRFGYLYAPANGVVSEVVSEKDENVSAGQTVAIMNAGKNMEINLGIPESAINGVKEGMNVLVDFSALPGKKFDAKVTEVAPAVDGNTATYPVLVAILDSDPAIKSGMAANVRFDFGKQQSTTKSLTVPINAVGEDSNGRFVFLIKEQGEQTIVEKHPIVVGDITSQGFVVKEGLAAGQKIATAGLQTLLDGQEVKLP
ncbi:MAG: efflux RND transporter periplasmic adaptor subunit [Bacteroidota bacterium]